MLLYDDVSQAFRARLLEAIIEACQGFLAPPGDVWWCTKASPVAYTVFKRSNFFATNLRYQAPRQGSLQVFAYILQQNSPD